MKRGTILIVGQDRVLQEALRTAVRREGLTVELSTTVVEALSRLRANNLQAVITDEMLPDGSGLDLLRRIHDVKPGMPVILITGAGSIHDAVSAIKLGAHDYIARPVRPAVLENSLRGALREEPAPAAAQSPMLRGLITADYRMLRICDTLLSVADTAATVLIDGESGTGKTMMARLLHENSVRREGPFVEVNCAALPEGLLESELFGHVRGAFTSAVTHREGKLEAANHGTLLLDEIANASMPLQMKLLRVLESFEFEPVGGTETRRVDVRLVTATNRSLEERVAAGAFRADLWHRLNVVRVSVPPLRERVQDIPPLSRHFAAVLARKYGRPEKTIASEAMQRLLRYRWPGNVRELRNAIEHGMIMAIEDEIRGDDLPMWVNVEEGRRGADAGEYRTLKEALQEPERRTILNALRKTGWNKHLAARKLGVSRSTLYSKIKEHGIDDEP